MDTKELKNKQFLKKRELSKLSGTRASSIKYYSEIGILPFKQEGTRLHRVYDREFSLERLKNIKILKNKGYSIEQIKKTLSMK